MTECFVSCLMTKYQGWSTSKEIWRGLRIVMWQHTEGTEAQYLIFAAASKAMVLNFYKLLEYTTEIFLFWYQGRAFFIIYNLTNDCTIISDTIITNKMLLHVSTFKMSSSESSLCLAKITYRFSGLSKIKLLKHKMINFSKLLIVQRNKRFA